MRTCTLVVGKFASCRAPPPPSLASPSLAHLRLIAMEHLFDEDDEVTTATEGVEQTTLLIARLESAPNRARARLTVWRAQERQEERRRLAERLGLRVARSILVIEVSLGNCLRRLFVTDRHGRADCAHWFPHIFPPSLAISPVARCVLFCDAMSGAGRRPAA